MSGNLKTTITTYVAPSGFSTTSGVNTLYSTSIPNLNVSATSSATPGAAGTPTYYSDGMQLPTLANIQYIYALSDILDATITFYSAAAGGGTVEGHIYLTAGIPYVWSTANGTLPASTLGAAAVSVGVVAEGTKGATWNGAAWTGGTPTTAAVTCNVTMYVGLSV